MEPAGQEESQETAGGAGDCTEMLHWTTLLLDPVIECFVTGNQLLRRESSRGPQRQPRDNRCATGLGRNKELQQEGPSGNSFRYVGDVQRGTQWGQLPLCWQCLERHFSKLSKGQGGFNYRLKPNDKMQN